MSEASVFRVWLGSAVLAWVLVCWLTRNWAAESESSWKGIVRISFRSFPVAYSFTPTLVLAGWFAFPMPATLVVMSFWLKPPAVLQHVDRMNFRAAIAMFVVVWFLASIAGYLLARRRSDNASGLADGKTFLIRCVEGTWFKLHESQFPEVLRPSSFASSPVEGAVGKRIAVGGGQMEFSYRAEGIEVRYAGNSLSEGEMIQIVKEIAERVTTATGQPSEVVSL